MPLKKEIFYVSNLISLSRFVLLAFTSYFLINKNYSSGVIFIILIWISDLLDGYFARKRNEISELGKIIDPLADKVSIITIVLILTFQYIIPLWFVIIVIFRDFLILSVGLYLKYRKNIVLQSNWLGKTAVFTIGLTIVIFIIIKLNFFYYVSDNAELLSKIMLLLSVTTVILSLVSYFKRFKEISNSTK